LTSGVSTTTATVVGAVSKNYTAPCGAGSDNGMQQGYKDGQPQQIRTCTVGGIQVNTALSANIDALLKDAKAAGINFSGGGFRTMASQQYLYNKNCSGGSCSPPTATPGYSNHQMGLAIDFDQNGHSIDANDSGYKWLQQNAAKYGLINFEQETWHWSIDGH